MNHDSTEDHATDVARLLQSETVACGESLDDLLQQVAQGAGAELDDHQRDCKYCQSALTELSSVWEPFQTAATQPVLVPDDITAKVMSRIHAMAQNVWYSLELSDLGAIRVAARIVATLARDTARRVPGVRVAFGRSSTPKIAQMVERATLTHRHPHAAIGVLGRTAVVDLAVAVTYGDAIDDVARQVQRDVIAALRRDIGLKDVKVNVTVDDVLDIA